MFNKEPCRKCGEKISNKYEYCPYCGQATGKPKEDWGMLGKNDLMEQEGTNPFANPIFGGISGKMLNKMLGSAMKMLEKEMQKGMSGKEMPLNTNFELYVNGKRVSPENIKVIKKAPAPSQKEMKKISHKNAFSEESLQKFTSLKKEEPITNVRRLSNKVIYEIEMPGVGSIDDVAIVKLESSIEIKALGKDKAYKKIIPIDLPLRRYRLEDQKLILELGVRD